MTNYDWVRWLFQIIPEDIRVTEPKEKDQAMLCAGLHLLRDLLRDSDSVGQNHKWKFSKLSDECGMFSMGIKKIYWWLDPEKAMVTTGDIDSKQFLDWCKTEYKRVMGI